MWVGSFFELNKRNDALTAEQKSQHNCPLFVPLLDKKEGENEPDRPDENQDSNRSF